MGTISLYSAFPSVPVGCGSGCIVSPVRLLRFPLHPYTASESSDHDSLRTFRKGLVDEIEVAASLASSQSVVSMRRQFHLSLQAVRGILLAADPQKITHQRPVRPQFRDGKRLLPTLDSPCQY
jgi:hypothetical protein